MPKWIPAILLVVAVLLFSYGVEQRHAGRDAEKERVFRDQITNAARHADSLSAGLRTAKKTADSLSRLVPALRARRATAVAASDSVLVRVDSAVSSVGADSLVPLRLVESLRGSLLSEREASSVLVASLESSVSSLRVVIASQDSVISVQSTELSSYASLVKVLEREAHPSMLSRSLTFARHAAIGAAVMAVVILVR